MKLNTTTIVNLITRTLPLSDWSFKESARFDSGVDSIIIFNSQWCRVKFLIEREMVNDFLRVSYGRLHAPDRTWIMNWNGENHYCWHAYPPDIRLMLEFLDGISPQQAHKWKRTPLPFFEDYYNSKNAKAINDNVEQDLGLHAKIWKHYGLRFFELLDLRRPDLWEQYLNFLKEYYKLDNIGLAKESNPSQYQRC